jgi:hypothetical protein
MITRSLTSLVTLVFLVAGCNQSGTSGSGGAPPAASAHANAPQQSLGNVMAEVARRFEIAGKAANANRFELAEFEAGEIQELFETDVPAASLPKEGPTAHIPVMAKAFLETNAPELEKAAAAKDRAAFATAFEHAAMVCNTCHQASAKAFIQVPTVPGKGVPDLEPVQAAAAPH